MKHGLLPVGLFCGLTLAQTTSALGADPVDFVKEVQPILELNCVKCHGPEKPKGRLRLDSRAASIQGGDNGTSLVPGEPDKSKLYTTTILPPDHDDVMPPAKEPRLTKEQTDTLKRWIAEGAKWPENLTLKAVRRIDFVKDIKPILEFDCVACHREGHVKGGLRMDEKARTFTGGDSGPGIVPGKADKSLVYTSTTVPKDDDRLMPPANKGGPLPKETTDVLKEWINQGAYWPDSERLTPRKREEAPGANEGETVAAIHQMIVAKLGNADESKMARYTNTIPGTMVSYVMLPIPSGEFVMGSPASEAGRNADEGPQHKVKISPFWMGRLEVTWNEFELFMYTDQERKFKDKLATDPAVDKVSDAVTRPTKPYVEMSFGMGRDGFPAISMTQHAANKYCQWLSAKTGEFYRLPTEAEWEYACRAGTTTAYSFGNDPAQLGAYAWYEKNSDFKYQKVGRKNPNPWGLHDMHGNVAEWCLDGYEPSYESFAGALRQDPWVKAAKPYPHVVKGGSWDDEAHKLRSAVRRASDKTWKIQDPQLPKSVWYHTDAQFLGFRIVRPLKVPPPEELHKCWTSGVEKD